jgi:hypothetical protein
VSLESRDLAISLQELIINVNNAVSINLQSEVGARIGPKIV